MQAILLNVEGMTCSHCENAVKKAVGELDGVLKVDVSLADKTVSVEFDPAKVTSKDIENAIEDQGYEVVK
ncbi:MAG: copper chaperone CopZ [Christensenellales bacterium]|jgi:copper chaperone